ncbi:MULTISPECIES: efflux RND transporter periplasmic adaptor subunit [Thermaerobacter]|uniref:Efflux RND transporter periplasmic adaptor subunit n=1 Tax=Thermaerobacter composti TaxID=554949 RepID=A0ABZ0QKS0_9FIRM|nr:MULTISPECIES: efflux RND transporter periplasmic adaptor subunit [Thermaerobacter]QBS38070.1 efflux RND transporter periplasmic adaptor subunit [Thermaerobacter sp. FW80]WPD18088.1 efflux RND transporter periplasmic adaptor subunit [Thermaerobacter composti]
MTAHHASPTLRRRGNLAAALVIAALVLGACGTRAGNGAAGTGGSEPPAAVPVEVAEAVPGTLAQPVELPGRVRARAEVPVRPQVAGPITAVHVEVGQRVRKGQVLVELDAAAAEAQVRQAEAALAAARAAVRQAEQGAEGQRLQADAEYRQAQLAHQGAAAQLDGARQALAALERQWQALGCDGAGGAAPGTPTAPPAGAAAAGGAPAGAPGAAGPHGAATGCGQLAASLAEARAAVRQAEFDLEAAKVRLDAARRARELARRGDPAAAARAQVDQAEAALALARQQLERTRVTAPVDGVVAAVAAEVGTLASPQAPEPLVILVDPGPVQVAAELPVGLYDAVDDGARVEVVVGQQTWPGRVRSKTRVPDARTGAYTLTVDLEPASGARWPAPGQPATVRLSMEGGTRGLLIPVDALQEGDEPGRGTVFVVEGGRAERREVRYGTVTAERALILEGLQPGERVITRGADGLAGGERVRVVPPS